MARVFLSLGSNLGDRSRNLEEAICLIGTIQRVRVVRASSFYEAEPWWGVTGQHGWYLNCAVEIETSIAPKRLLGLLQGIESQLGRVEKHSWFPRTMDIDILLYADRVVDSKDLQVPHLMMHERRFVLEPLAEIAPDLEHPVLYRKIRELLDEVEDSQTVLLYNRR